MENSVQQKRAKMTRTLEDWVEYIYDMNDPSFFPTRERLVCEINTMLDWLSADKNWKEFETYGYDNLIHWERYFPAFVRTAIAEQFSSREVPKFGARGGGHAFTTMSMSANAFCHEPTATKTELFMASFHRLVLQRLETA